MTASIRPQGLWPGDRSAPHGSRGRRGCRPVDGVGVAPLPGRGDPGVPVVEQRPPVRSVGDRRVASAVQATRAARCAASASVIQSGTAGRSLGRFGGSSGERRSGPHRGCAAVTTGRVSEWAPAMRDRYLRGSVIACGGRRAPYPSQNNRDARVPVPPNPPCVNPWRGPMLRASVNVSTLQFRFIRCDSAGRITGRRLTSPLPASRPACGKAVRNAR